MGAELQTEATPQHIYNHKAYVQSWIQAIREKPETLVKAIKDAQAAANYMDYMAGLITEKEYEKACGSIILLSAVFQRYVPQDLMVNVFGGNEAWGVLMAATIGVPLYACGGGTIPLLQSWLAEGMSLGSAAAFMITGPSTKITNLGALKIVLGAKRFILYLLFVITYALITGLLINIIPGTY